MDEYISKQDAVDAGYLSDWYISSVGDEPPIWTDGHIDELLNDFLVIPKDTPVADVQPVKHGRWINLTPPEWRESYRKHWAGCIYWMCSECKSAVAFLSEDMPYDLCPNCGARMDLRDGDSE